MNLHILTYTLVGLLMVADEPVKDEKSIQGVWKAVAGEYEGDKISAADLKTVKVVFKGTGLTLDFGEEKHNVQFKLDPAQKPKALDFLGSQRGKKFTHEAIYELEGELLKLCWEKGGAGNPRPKTFATKPKSDLILLILKREK